MNQRPETLQELFDQHGIVLHEPPRPGRNHGGARSKIYCPKCAGGGEKERNFYVKIDPDGQGATWICHRANHCGFSGGSRLSGSEDIPQSWPRVYRRPEPPTEDEFDRPASFFAYFAKFGISEATLLHFGVYRGKRRMPVLDDNGRQTQERREIPVLVYPYRSDGELTNRKFKAIYPRCGKKRFEQETGAEPTLYNIDAFVDAEAGYFVEGEDDCLALFECGFRQVTTIPNGSPPKIADRYDPRTDDDERYLPLRPGDERIDRIKRWYLAGDMDPAGTRHMEEAARRLGKHRCWLVRWPDGCKDAKETLHLRGPEAVLFAIKRALPYPLPGVDGITDAAIEAMYRREEGWRFTTGYQSLDERIKLSGIDNEGLFVVTTGIPGHGKTAFWNSYAVLLAERNEQLMELNPALRPFHTVILSTEMRNNYVVRDLISAHSSKPFYPVKTGAPRMSLEEALEGHAWVHKHFTLLKWDQPRKRPTISWALDSISNVVRQKGAKLAIIDPWQEFDDEMPLAWAKTSSKWIVNVLCGLRGFAEELAINLVLVVHPAKMRRNKDGRFDVPTGYDIGDSQGFSSVSQVGLTVHRPNLGADDNDDMDVHCWKTRDGLLFGSPGVTSIRFDRHTRRLWPLPTVAEAMGEAA